MSKKNFILIIILIALAASAYIYQGPFKNWQQQKEVPKNFLAKVDINKVNKIEITKNGGTVTLVASVYRWKVENTKDFYVSDTAANSLISKLKEAVKDQLEIVSQNKDKKSDFSTDASGIAVKLKQDNQELANFIVGKTASDYLGTYISQENSDKTYLTKVDLASVFFQDDWRDKTIFASDKTKINKIRIQSAGKEFIIVKEGENWIATGTKAVKLNNDKVTSLADLLSSLVASEIPEQKFDSTGLEKNNLIIQATGDGIDNTLIIGNDNGKGMYYVKTGASDNIYLITKTERDNLNKQIKDLQ